MRHMIGAAAALALAACGGGGDKAAEGGNAAASASAGGEGTKAGGAAGGGAAAAMQPGQWEITSTVEGIEGLPAGMPAGATPPPTSTRVCLTAEQVAQPGAGVATGGVTNQAGCRTESNTNSGGRIESNVQCEAPGGGRVRVATTGQTNATSFDFQQRTEVSAQGTNMTTRTRVTGRRLGDCPA